MAKADQENLYQPVMAAVLNEWGSAVATALVPAPESGKYASIQLRIFEAGGDGIVTSAISLGGRQSITALRDLCDAALKALPEDNENS